MKIFTNGTMTFHDGRNGISDYDADGFPIEAKKFDTEVICYIDTREQSRDGQNESGKYTRQSYVVSFDYDDVYDDFNPQEIGLKHDKQGDLGTFTVKRIEYLDLTRTINIYV